MKPSPTALRDALLSFGVERTLMEHAERTVAVRGGGIDTALLEAGAPPSLVVSAIERATGLSCASEAQLEPVAADTLRRIDADLAARCRIVPLAENRGVLVVAASAAAANVAAELLGCPVEVLVCPEYRLQLELTRRYGIPLAERHAVLAARLLGAKAIRVLLTPGRSKPRAPRVPPQVSQRALRVPTPVPPPPAPAPAPAPVPVDAPKSAEFEIFDATPLPAPMPPPPTEVEPPVKKRPTKAPPAPEVKAPVAQRPDFPRMVGELDALELGGMQSDASQLLQHGGREAVLALLSGFPGKVLLNRRHPPDARKPIVEHGPRLRVLWSVVKDALPDLIRIASEGNSDARWYALALLGEEPSSQTVAAAADRLFDDDEGVRALAIDVLLRIGARSDHSLEPDLKAVRARLRAALSAISGAGAGNATRRRRAAEALGALRAEDAVSDLMSHVASVDPDLAQAVRRALFAITRHDFGEKEKKWRAWWDKNQGKHRIEWLLDSLADDSDETRLLASEELKRITGEWFGYQFDLPKGDREAARKKWVNWWQDTGRRRFVRGSP